MNFSPKIRIRTTILLSIASLGIFCALLAQAREITVSEKLIVTGETQPFSSPKDFPFTVAGGTVLGSSMPMRAYFTVEGVAESGGTLTAKIDGSGASSVTVTLPSSDNRAFSFVVPDVAGLLSHAAAGTYAHTLTLDPGGVNISVASIHVTNTYTWDIGSDCPEGDETSTKQKTVHLWLGSDLDLSGQTDLNVKYDLVDNMAGISGPVTSAYAEVTGNYSGSGTITLSWPESPSSTVTYTLAASDGPRQISLLSPSNPSLFQAGGAQNHTVRISSTGVSFMAASAKFLLTYQYHPRAIDCGGFPPTGEFTSEAFDTAYADPLFNSITWRGTLGGSGNDTGHVKFQMATAACANGANNPPLCNTGSWQWIGGVTCSSADWFDTEGPGKPFDLLRSGCYSQLDGKQYYRYKVQLCAIDCTKNWPTTPTVNEVYISWSP